MSEINDVFMDCNRKKPSWSVNQKQVQDDIYNLFYADPKVIDIMIKDYCSHAVGDCNNSIREGYQQVFFGYTIVSRVSGNEKTISFDLEFPTNYTLNTLSKAIRERRKELENIMEIDELKRTPVNETENESHTDIVDFVNFLKGDRYDKVLQVLGQNGWKLKDYRKFYKRNYENQKSRPYICFYFYKSSRGIFVEFTFDGIEDDYCTNVTALKAGVSLDPVMINRIFTHLLMNTIDLEVKE